MPEFSAAASIAASVERVLETMCFTSVMADCDGGWSGDAIEARVAFSGHQTGQCAIRLSSAAARAIAANFVGAEDEAAVPSRTVDDTVCELANMICGALLSCVAEDALFDIAHPEIVPAGLSPLAGAVRSFELDNGYLTVAIVFDGEKDRLAAGGPSATAEEDRCPPATESQAQPAAKSEF